VREYVLTLLVTAAVTYILTPLVRRLALKGGAMHEARDRDVHVVPIPLLGGLAMYAGLAVGLLVASMLVPLNGVLSGSNMAAGLLLAGGLIVAIGIVDDRWGMNAISKLAGQVAAGAILVASGCELGWLPLPGGGTFSPTSNQATVLTILVVVATINAVNFIDGLDGLAAGIVAIAAVSFFIYYYWLTHVLRLSAEAVPALASAVLFGMCLGFLPHNFFPARIFMGDTGSMLLGLLLAYAPISSTTLLDPQTLHGNVNRFPEVLPLLLPTAILVIPYSDMAMAVIRRTRAGMSPFAPDRKHLHHRLLDIGHSHRLSVLIMYLWAALFSGLVIWFSTSKTPLFVFGVITLGAVLALLLMSMPRLRWWERSRRQSAALAVASGVPAAGRPAGAGQQPVAGNPVVSSRATASVPLAAPPPLAAAGEPAAGTVQPSGSAQPAAEPPVTAQPAQPEPARPDWESASNGKRSRSVVGTLPPSASDLEPLPLGEQGPDRQGRPDRPDRPDPHGAADREALLPETMPIPVHDAQAVPADLASPPRGGPPPRKR
jgi:UDP-GlcNAc:undecaprenyl-phosphate GlcNAc-1-phosphate transferase